MQLILDEHVLQPMNTHTNSCMMLSTVQHTVCETNLPYSSLVTLYMRSTQHTGIWKEEKHEEKQQQCELFEESPF